MLFFYRNLKHQWLPDRRPLVLMVMDEVMMTQSKTNQRNGNGNGHTRVA
jgi:hypothetical protein